MAGSPKWQIKLDFVVVGGGFAGLSTALRLAEMAPGASIAVLEASYAGYGASGRNAGLISPLPAPVWLVTAGTNPGHAWALKRLNERTHELAGWLGRDIPGSAALPATLQIEATGAITRAGLERVSQLLDKCAIGHRRAADRGRSPLVLELPANTIDPYATVVGLTAKVRQLGIAMHEGAAVAGIEEGGQTVMIRLTDGRSVEARSVVICTNAYSGSIRMPGKVRARAVYNYMLATEELSAELLGRFPVSRSFVVELNTDYVFYRLHRNRLIYGGIDRMKKQEDDFAVPGKVLSGLERLMDASLPGTELKAEQAWAGRYHMTHTELPQIERTGARGSVILNVGYGGTGIALTMLCARLAASLAAGKPIDDPDERRLLETIQQTRLPIIAGALLAAGVAGDIVLRRGRSG